MTRTILLADDSVTIQKVVELTFMDQDYEIVAVSDGSAAVAKLPDLKPDLLIADVHMPGADGYEVCRRSKSAYPDVPVLLLVGTFEHFDEAAAAAAGAESHLKKPFDSQDLLHQVETLISGAGLPGEGEEPPERLDLEPSEPSEDDEPTAVSEAAFELEEEAPEAGTPFPLSAEAEAPTAEPSFEDAWGTAGSGTPMVASPLLGGPPGGDQAPPAKPSFEDLWGVGAAAPAAEPPAAEPPPAPAAEPPPAPAAEPPPAPAAEPPPGSATEPAMEAWTVEAPTFEEAPLEAPAEGPSFAEPSFAEPSFAEPSFEEVPAAEALPAAPAAAEEPAAPAPAVAAAPAAEAPAETPASGGNDLSDEDVDRIARRVMELAGDKALREVAWEVVPDLAEVIIKERIRELESQVE